MLRSTVKPRAIVLVALFAVVGAADYEQTKLKHNDNLSFHTNILQIIRGPQDTHPFREVTHLNRAVVQQHSAQDLDNVFTELLNDNWENSQLLLELADSSNELSIKATIYEILFEALKTTKKVYNPFELIQLYRAVEFVVSTICLNNNGIGLEFGYGETQECMRIIDVKLRLRGALTSRCTQLLEAMLYNFSVDLYKCLLYQLNSLEDEIYIESLEQMFDAVNDLMPMDQLATVIGNLSSSIKQSVVANLQLLKRLPTGVTITGNLMLLHDNDPFTILMRNLKGLLNQPDFDKIEPRWRSSVYDVLPVSIRNLYVASKVCIRNATNPQLYLYECAETYLMCVDGAPNLQQAAYVAERSMLHGEETAFTFRSLHWTNRYIRLEGNATGLPESPQTASANFTKNVYSKQGAQHWLVEWRGDNVAFLDASLKFYLCAGASSEWDDEKHAYTRRAAHLSSFQGECEWFIEDCSHK